MFILNQSDFSERDILTPRFFVAREKAIDEMMSDLKDQYNAHLGDEIEAGEKPEWEEFLRQEAPDGEYEGGDFGFSKKAGTAWSNLNDDYEYDWQVCELPANVVPVMPDGTHVFPNDPKAGTVAWFARELADITARGYGDMAIVYRDDDTDPDPDIYGCYVDEEADRVVMSGNFLSCKDDILSCDKNESEALPEDHDYGFQLLLSCPNCGNSAWAEAESGDPMFRCTVCGTEANPEDLEAKASQTEELIHFEHCGKQYSMTSAEIHAAYFYQEAVFALQTADEKFCNFAIGVDDLDCIDEVEQEEKIADFEYFYRVSFEDARKLSKEFLEAYQEAYQYYGCNAAENDLWEHAFIEVLQKHKRGVTIEDITRWILAGACAPEEDFNAAKKWLLEYQAANQYTLNEFCEICWKDLNWFFKQIFGDEKFEQIFGG